MSQRVILNLGQGSWQRGFPDVAVQLWEANSTAPIQFSGSLPAQAVLGQQYDRWRSLYLLLYDHQNPWRSADSSSADSSSADSSSADSSSADSRLPDSPSADSYTTDFQIEIEEDDITNVSVADFEQLGQDLQRQLNVWLDAATFRPIDRKLRTHLSPTDEIQVMVAAKDHEVLRFPWQLWQLFEDYPKAELALSPVEYNRSIKETEGKAIALVKVLVILGNSQGIEVETDRQLLSGLPGASVTVLAEPSLDTLNQHLWHQRWDIFFFAGHSSSQGAGRMLLNQTDRITIGQLKYGLKQAIAHGLQLAIFNSCDGLGLAWDLADLHIPQTIVMREPVPDRVAHTFLKHLLTALANNSSLYLAVRSAREKLQSLEQDCPWATQLPVIVQNPAERTLTWAELQETELQETKLQEAPGPEIAASLSMPVSGARPGIARPGVAPSGISPPDRFIPSGSVSERGVYPRRSPAFRRLILQGQLLYPVMVTILTLALRFLGVLEPMELQSLDQLMRRRSMESPDDRFLVVTIDDIDLQAQPAQRRSSLSDEALDQLLDILEQHQARLIGLDIYRDFPVSADYPRLTQRLRQSDRFVAVCKGRDPIYDPVGVAPPPEVAADFVGFSDFVEDADGIIRRHLLSMDPDPAAACTTPYAFSSRLAFAYFEQEAVDVAFDPEGSLVIDGVVFPSLQPRSGGYQPTDSGGTQILLNYRALPSPEAIAPQVSLTQLLNGDVIPSAIRDRIVLIGVTANSVNDYWSTPYGVAKGEQTAGVFIQAQMTSHLLSAVLDGRPVLRSVSPRLTLLWVWGWALVGGAIVLMPYYFYWIKHQWSGETGTVTPPRLLQFLLWMGAGGGLLIGSALVCLVFGYWVPLVPAGLAFLGSGLTGLRLCRRLNHPKSSV